jgi:hypothetical protein
VVSAADPLRSLISVFKTRAATFLSSSSSFTLTRDEWTPFQTHCYSENLVAPGIETHRKWFLAVDATEVSSNFAGRGGCSVGVVRLWTRSHAPMSLVCFQPLLTSIPNIKLLNATLGLARQHFTPRVRTVGTPRGRRGGQDNCLPL